MGFHSGEIESREPMRAILCDDHPIVLLSTTMLLEAHGHEVVHSIDHPATIPEMVRSLNPDVCLMDLFFNTDDDGAATLEAIRAVAEFTDVIVVSGAADEGIRLAAMEAGASAVASKAMATDAFIALVEGRGPGPTVLAAPDPDHGRFGLTRRELEVLGCLIDGDCTARIATRLDMRSATVRSHVQNLMLKLGVHTRAAAVARAVTTRLVDVSA